MTIVKTLYLVIILLIFSLIIEHPSHAEASCSPPAYQLERQPAPEPPLITDLSGSPISGDVEVGKQIQISTWITDQWNCDHSFAYLVQIQNTNGVTVSLSWITGTLYAGESLNPAQSWTPFVSGTYTAQVFVWQSIDNPNALSPPVSTTINVVGTLNGTIFDPSYRQTICKNPTFTNATLYTSRYHPPDSNFTYVYISNDTVSKYPEMQAGIMRANEADNSTTPIKHDFLLSSMPENETNALLYILDFNQTPRPNESSTFIDNYRINTYGFNFAYEGKYYTVVITQTYKSYKC